MIPTLILFTIIFLEGYIVLSSELLAIRLLLPFTGSGTDTVSIIIAAVLMPLAFGYFYGGRFTTKIRKNGRAFLVRDKLIRNLVIAALFLTPGLSYICLQTLFDFVHQELGWTNRIWLTTIYSLTFLAIPVFLLGQTVPLISNYFSRRRLPEVAGRILFFSTLGSFMGAVFCTLVLMSTIGVHNTVTVTIFCMTLLTILLAKKKISAPVLFMIALFGVATYLNSDMMMTRHHIVKNNLYNLIQIEEHIPSESLVLKLNRTYASAVYKYEDQVQRLPYVSYIEDTVLRPLYENIDPQNHNARDILVLGAGGFTMGRIDTVNNYTFVDIDKDLKNIAETLLLREKLGPNKSFQAIEARAFLNQSAQKYDVIILDLYRDPISAPEYLVTAEFLRQVKDHLKEGGVMAGNYFASPSFADKFSMRLDNTLRAVFPHINRHVIKPYSIWDHQGRTGEDWTNIIYIYKHNTKPAAGIYTDNKNLSPFDKPDHVR